MTAVPIRSALFAVCSLGALALFGAADERSKEAKPARPDDAIDRHALAAPATAEQSIAALAKYLAEPAKNDREKARAIFRWMTDRIAYDADSFLAGRPAGDCSAAAVFRTRKTVCAGYADLFAQLCTKTGLEAATIHGYAKGYGYTPDEKARTNHAWNAVKIDGAWRLVDATWASGSVDARKGFLKALDEYFFLTPPESLIFTHLPEQPRWQLLDPPVARQTFIRWPKIEVGLFKGGVSPRQVRLALEKKDFPGFPEAHGYPGTRVRFIDVPMTKRLRPAQPYTFRVEAAGIDKLAVVNGKDWHYLTRKGNVYEVRLTPSAGDLRLSVRLPGKGNNYWPVLIYTVGG